MAYWDGRDRTPKQWKSLRLEIGAAIKGLASDPQWHKVFVACAELPLLETLVLVAPPDSSPTTTPPTGRAETSAALAACTDPGKLALAEQSEMAVAIAYFCGGRCSATALDVGVFDYAAFSCRAPGYCARIPFLELTWTRDKGARIHLPGSTTLAETVLSTLSAASAC